jgi:hypothetical protein
MRNIQLIEVYTAQRDVTRDGEGIHFNVDVVSLGE